MLRLVRTLVCISMYNDYAQQTCTIIMDNNRVLKRSCCCINIIVNIHANKMVYH